MNNQDSVVAVYDTHEQAEEAVHGLQTGGVDIKCLSIAARDTHADEDVIGCYSAGDRMKYWGKKGAFWGAIWGLLFGSALFAVPGVGPVLIAGPLVGCIVAGLESAIVVGGVGALGAGLVSMGIPQDCAVKYEASLKTDKFLLIVHGPHETVLKARELIGGTRYNSYTVHDETVLSV
jgi:hypothetical protein